MSQPPSKYAAPASLQRVQETLREARERSSFAKVDPQMIAAIGRLFSPAVALILDLQRLSGLSRIRRRDGWMQLTQEILSRVGVSDKNRRYRTLQGLTAEGVLEVRRLNTYGNKLEYRLNPHWAKPKAEVVDPAAARSARNG